MSYNITDYKPYDFANRRHIGPSPLETKEMLDIVGANDLDDLIEQTIPVDIRQKKPLQYTPGLSESELLNPVLFAIFTNPFFQSNVFFLFSRECFLLSY